MPAGWSALACRWHGGERARGEVAQELECATALGFGGNKFGTMPAECRRCVEAGGIPHYILVVGLGIQQKGARVSMAGQRGGLIATATLWPGPQGWIHCARARCGRGCVAWKQACTLWALLRPLLAGGRTPDRIWWMIHPGECKVLWGRPGRTWLVRVCFVFCTCVRTGGTSLASLTIDNLNGVWFTALWCLHLSTELCGAAANSACSSSSSWPLPLVVGPGVVYV